MNILITGGTGFLGKELTKQFVGKKDYTVTVFGRNEANLSIAKQDKRVNAVCGDVRDYDAIYRASKEYSVDIIIHAAALKRIDTCQDNPIEAYKTNVEGTWNCIRVCKEINAQLCYISTDKACEPCTTYGATKYLAEQLVRRESQRYKFRGFVVRYGNVLDSTGSVLGIWKKQFEKDGKVQVRDKGMTRFFWTVKESVEFIEESIAKSNLIGLDYGINDVFIPNIKSLNIYDMACFLYGEENVVVTKCDHTEKIHESLSGDMCSKDHVVSPGVILSKP